MNSPIPRSDVRIRWCSPHAVIAVSCLLWMCGEVGQVQAAEESRTGEQIYKAHCLECHGEQGVGSSNHKSPLLGDLSIGELTRIIDRTMPEGEPEKCVGEDAQKVAAYIHEAFYSPTAQFRNQPPRRELSRLTVRQHQQILADLIGNFRGRNQIGDERGLKAQYYKHQSYRDRAFERVDEVVQFDFGTEVPDKEKLNTPEYSIRWEGSVLAPETADYEFIVRSGHAVRLWINDLRQPLVDGYVQSGDQVEYTGTIRLTGGRAYPLKLDFSKANQGVKSDKHQKRDKPAFVTLMWKLPQRVPEVIPQRFLSPKNSSEVFVLQTAFPPDDRSIGYERGTSVSAEWKRAATEAALEVTDYISQRIRDFAGTKSDAKDYRERVQKFCQSFAERAFRRPLNDEERKIFVDQHFAAEIDTEFALKRSLLLVLQSPRFLYVDLGGLNENPYDVATRLSLGLWDTIPDDELRRAASANELKTADQVRQQAQRMLADGRAKAKVHEFFLRWLKVDQVPDLSKDSEHYTGFSPEVACDLRTSLELFIDQIVWSEKSDFRELLLADKLPLNGRLAEFYGIELPKESGYQNIAADDSRNGLLTHPYLLSSFAYTDSTSPIHRGVFISRALLGRALKNPPMAVAPTAPHLQPDLTTRERIAEQTKAEACIVCHGMINPLGFSLESFDAVGRFRKEELGKQIDTSGQYITKAGNEVKFSGSRDLANFLAENPETHDAFVDQLFHYLIKQPIRAYDAQTVQKLRQSFRDNEFSITKLVAEIVTTAALPPADQPAAKDLSQN